MFQPFRPVVFLFLVFLGTVSCEQGNSGKSGELDLEVSDKALPERTFEKGVVIDPLVVEGRALETYALYLPKNFFPGYTWPTVLFFDPQGNGKKPLELYRNLADQFGFILIGSNFSKNGKSFKDIAPHIEALKNGLPEELKIDPFRIFLVGFSGGARVAVAEAMANGDIAGVVGCGAGFPQLKSDAELQFHYLAMVGRQDFNYSEFVVLDKELSSRGSGHLLIEYNGKHAWPDPGIMLEAFKWMTVYSYSQREVIDMELMDSLHKDDISKLQEAESSGDVRSLGQYYKKMIGLYKGLANVEEEEKRLERLSSSDPYRQYQAELETIMSKEMKMRNHYMQLFGEKDEKWWEQDIAKMKKEIARGTDKLLRDSRQRILAYLSVSAFMQTEDAITKELLPQASKSLFIFNLVDPENVDYYYLSAKLLLKQGRNEEAVDQLKQAAKYGFEDWDKVQAERIFDPVRSYLKTMQ